MKPITLYVTRSAIRSGLNNEGIADYLGVPPAQIVIIESLKHVPIRETLKCGLWINFDQKLDALMISQFRNLAFVATTSTGTNHIDTTMLQTVGAKLIHLEKSDRLLHKVTATADLAVAMILGATTGLFRDLNKSLYAERIAITREKQVSNLKVGIVGLGRIGSEVAKRLDFFGSVISYCDPEQNSTLDDYATKWQKISLLELIQTSDVISLHASYKSGQPPLLGEREFKLINEKQHLINTARSGLVDKHQVLKALLNNKLLTYSTDFPFDHTSGYNIEASEKVNYLINSGKLFITPHIGGASRDAAQTTEKIVMSKILDYYQEVV